MRYTLLMVLLSLCIVAEGQKIYVRSSSTGDPAFSVLIYNQDKSTSTITNLNGMADISRFDATDTLFFQHLEFEPDSIPYPEVAESKEVRLKRQNRIIDELHVISSSKHIENRRKIPFAIDVVTTKTLEYIPSQNSADLLLNTGNIFVQKSQVGGGSPILRGFEANKVLLVVDGIRMNNAIYRSGHLQNSITIDNAILERAEIIYGPASVIYGSDALGGVVHYITKSPDFADSVGKPNINMHAYTRYATANSSSKNHINFNIGAKNFASLTSITYGKYGNLRFGTRRNPFYGDWGKQFWYVDRINGIDSVVANKKNNIIPNSGYNQIDFLQKFRYNIKDKADLGLNIQYSESSDLNRHDQLTNQKNGLPKYSEWYYGPQKRFLAAFTSEHKANRGVYSSFLTSVAYQNIQESRFTRKFRSDTLYKQEEAVDILSVNLDFVKYLKKKKSFNYGVDYVQNFIGSKAQKQDINTLLEKPFLTRYPDAGTQTLNLGGYVSFKMNFADKLTLLMGSRYQYYNLKSEYGELFYDLPGLFKQINLVNNSLSGSIGLTHNQSESFKWNILLSTGFRSPNLDDLAKVRQNDDDIILPNPNLKPEVSYNAEIGFSKTFEGYIQVNLNYFTTYLNNAIVREALVLPDGSDSIPFQGAFPTTYQNNNAAEALIHGLNFSLVSTLNSNISFKSTLNYTYGRDITNNRPLAHIPPMYGRTELQYHIPKYTASIYFYYYNWKHISDMPGTGEDKHTKGTEYGFPGYYTLNLNSTFRFTPSVSLSLAIENLIDEFYHPFASGVPGPGINFVTTLRLKL